ncbi:hypothetical protein RDK54_13395, partial [Listeria monocytogenes]
EIYQSVPADAGLRRFYSGITCNHSVPPSMPLARHKHMLVAVSETIDTIVHALCHVNLSAFPTTPVVSLSVWSIFIPKQAVF